MKKVIFVLAAGAVLTFPSCKKDNVAATQHLFQGTATAMGNGTARSWVETDDNNKVKTVGITFDKTALTNLPVGDTMSGMMDETEYLLPLPAEKSLTPFSHVVVNWNPHGHPPEHVYDKPHFDLHFYMMSEADRNAIPDYMADSTGFLAFPALAYLPSNYVPIPGGEAKMGTHWVDVTSPELSQTNPQPFTQTFVYGSYNGTVTFYEPMVTLAYLTGTATFDRAIPQPTRFAKDGYYPTRMSITDKGTTIQVTLHDFQFHSKS